MRPENAIEVRNISKSFKVYYDKGNTIKEKLLFWKRSRYENRQVLKGISFDVKKGEAVGLIGHNGCGKSTTLKLLTKIMYPDSGTIEMKGRVCSLIELGAGFHPDMSGLENIYINAAIFGLNKAEIDKRLQTIIDFSELQEYIHNPVRTYSSGMYMRLAFSVAINVDADILLVDEILAVGDAAFQAKCFNRLREIKASGTTIVIVSHALGQIEQICERSLWIHEGLIKAEGKPRDVHPAYMDYMAEKERTVANISAQQNESVEEPKEETGNLEESSMQEQPEQKYEKLIRLKCAVLKDECGIITKSIRRGHTAALDVEYEAMQQFQDVIAGIAIYRVDGTHCYGTTTLVDGMAAFSLKKGVHSMSVMLPNIALLSGVYSIDWALATTDGLQLIYAKNAAELTVVSSKNEVGVFSVEHQWQID